MIDFDFSDPFLGETLDNDANTEPNTVERYSNDVAPTEHVVKDLLNASAQSGNKSMLQHHIPMAHFQLIFQKGDFLLMQKFIDSFPKLVDEVDKENAPSDENPTERRTDTIDVAKDPVEMASQQSIDPGKFDDECDVKITLVTILIEFCLFC